LARAGFVNIDIKTQVVAKEYAEKWAHNLRVGEYIMAASVKAGK